MKTDDIAIVQPFFFSSSHLTKLSCRQCKRDAGEHAGTSHAKVGDPAYEADAAEERRNRERPPQGDAANDQPHQGPVRAKGGQGSSHFGMSRRTRTRDVRKRGCARSALVLLVLSFWRMFDMDRAESGSLVTLLTINGW
jgi:hypothetical protein